MVLVFGEIIDLVIMTLALGFIFKDTFKHPVQDPWQFVSQKGFNWNDFWFACYVVAPSIIIHEMAHKFVALSMGMAATFHAALEWLAVGVFLKLMNFGFIFFVPGYVSISGFGHPLQFALISFAGPLMHLLIWQGAKLYLASHKNLEKQKHYFWHMVLQINKFLFILNMLPIPAFDGWGVYSNLLKGIGI